MSCCVYSEAIFGSTYYQGKGSQDVSYQNTPKTYSFFIAWEKQLSRDKSTLCYSSYTSIDDFLSEYDRTSEEERCFYEQFRTDYPRVEFYDIDGKFDDEEFAVFYESQCNLDGWIRAFLSSSLVGFGPVGLHAVSGSEIGFEPLYGSELLKLSFVRSLGIRVPNNFVSEKPVVISSDYVINQRLKIDRRGYELQCQAQVPFTRNL